MTDIKKLDLISSGDASTLLNVTPRRFRVLVEDYKIPYCKTGAGMIFLKSDVLAFQESRKEKMKHGRKKSS